MELLEDRWPGEDVNNEETSFCAYLESNLFFYSSWWVIIILQIGAILPLTIFNSCCLDWICRMEDGKSLISGENNAVLYFQGTFWFWFVYLILAGGHCGMDASEPLMITGIIFLLLAFIFNCFSWNDTDDKAVKRRSTLKELEKYFEQAKNMAPRDQISGKAYHEESSVNHNGKRTTEEKVSYEGSETFVYDKWFDISEFPDIGPATQENPLTVVAFTFQSKPGDSYTAAELELFRSNYKTYVEQLDADTGKFRNWLQVLSGNDSEEYHTKFVKKSKRGDSLDGYDVEKKDEINFDDILEDKYEHIFSVGPENLPWYMNKTLLFFLNFFCLSFLLKVIINNKCKRYDFVIKKVFYSNPKNPFDNYNFVTNPVMPYMGQGRETMPLVSATQARGLYTRTNPTVLHQPYGSCKTSSTPNTLISFFEDIKNHQDCQDY